MMRLRAAMVLLTGGALMAGCGGDRPPADPEPSTTAPEGAAIEESEAPAAPTAAELIRGEPDLATYVRLMGLARLSWALENAEGVILFAPTDEAFAALPEGTLEALLAEDGLATLTSILTYHVVPGKVMSTDILGQKLEAATAAGIPVAIDATMGSVMVGGAKVITADIETSNGVIHVIDAVILPPAAN